MKRLLAVFLGLLLVASCTRSSHDQTTKFHDDGRSKPTALLVPVFDHTDDSIPWNLSEEFTEAIHTRLSKKGNCFLASLESTQLLAQKLPQEKSPFGTDISWTKETFSPNEFVIFAELIKHDLKVRTPEDSLFDKIKPAGRLDIAVRLRVVDLRDDEPVVILQEVIENAYSIPNPRGKLKKDAWKNFTFSVSPLGFAHYQLSKEVAQNIEEYILLAKTK